MVAGGAVGWHSPCWGARCQHGCYPKNRANEHSAPLLFSMHGYSPVRIMLAGIPGNMKIVKYFWFHFILNRKIVKKTI